MGISVLQWLLSCFQTDLLCTCGLPALSHRLLLFPVGLVHFLKTPECRTTHAGYNRIPWQSAANLQEATSALRCTRVAGKPVAHQRESSLRPLLHDRSDWVHLSIFQVYPIGPSIHLYGAVDVNGLVSIYTCLPQIRSAKKNRRGSVLFCLAPSDQRAHRVKLAVSVSPLHMQSGHEPIICMLHSYLPVTSYQVA